ncbi:MAG: hypothetical protein R3286_21315 [Gammaproteobacteria bacterium]|nr:hypothetical protein [Gammaproteobacteria bacterium]
MQSKVIKRSAPLGVAALLLAMTATAEAAGVDKLRACLAAAETSGNPTLETSTCYWKHNEYMASYGR